jgi:hypothetical protein
VEVKISLCLVNYTLCHVLYGENESMAPPIFKLGSVWS